MRDPRLLSLTPTQRKLLARAQEGRTVIRGRELRTARVLEREGLVTLTARGPNGLPVVPYAIPGWRWTVEAVSVSSPAALAER